VPELVTAITEAHSTAALRGHDEAYGAARRSHDSLRRRVQSGKGQPEDVAALRQAEGTLAQATSSRDGYLGGLRTAALATLTPAQSVLLERIQANRSWKLPTPYLAEDRSEADWVRLRSALAEKRISEQDEDEVLTDATQTYLAGIDSGNEVATARVLLDANIAAVQTAWNQAASE